MAQILADRVNLKLRMLGVATHVENVSSLPIVEELHKYMARIEYRINQALTVEDVHALKVEIQNLRDEVLDIICTEEYLEYLRLKYPWEE